MIAKLPVLAGSAAVILLIVGVAAALGFRRGAKLDEAALQRLARNEGATVEEAVIAPDAKSAVARLSGGKLLIARVMGEDVSARIGALSAARVQRVGARLSIAFADLGYPPLHLKLAAPPAWLAELGAGERT